MAVFYYPSENPETVGYGKVRVMIETTANAATNSTLCKFSVQVMTAGSPFTAGTMVGSITIDGEKINLSGSKGLKSGSWVTFVEIERNIKHDSDGQKTLEISVAGTSSWNEGISVYQKLSNIDYYWFAVLRTATWSINLEAIAWKFSLTKTDDGHSTVTVSRQSSNEPTANIGDLANGDHIYYGDKLKVAFIPLMGYKARCKVDGEQITANPYALTVAKDVSVAVESEPMATIRLSNGSESEHYIITISDGIEAYHYQAYISDGEQWRVYC